MKKPNDAQLPMALEGGSLAPATVSQVLTPRLREVLELATDAKDAAQTIRRDRKLLAEAREAHKHLERMLQPMTREEVYRGLGELFLHRGPPKFDGELVDERGVDGLNNAWLDSWTRLLRPLTPEALALAVERWLQTSKWWPQVSELLELGKPLANEQRKLAYRVKFAVESVQGYRPPPTAEEKAQVRAALAEFQAQRTAGRQIADAPIVTANPNPERVSEIVNAGIRRARTAE